MLKLASISLTKYGVINSFCYVCAADEVVLIVVAIMAFVVI